MHRVRTLLVFLSCVIICGLMCMVAGCGRGGGSEETRQPPSLNTFVTIGFNGNTTK